MYLASKASFIINCVLLLLLFAVGNVVFINGFMEFLHVLFTGKRSNEQGKETEFLGKLPMSLMLSCSSNRRFSILRSLENKESLFTLDY